MLFPSYFDSNYPYTEIGGIKMNIEGKLLSKGQWIPLNSELARNLGVDEAVLIGTLAQLVEDENGIYTSTRELSKYTAIPLNRLRNAREHLRGLDIIDVKVARSREDAGRPIDGRVCIYKVNENMLKQYLN